MGKCAVSRYKLSGSHKTVTVQNLTYVQMRESGCIYHYESVMVAETKAKTVTSNLLQLTVLAAAFCVNRFPNWFFPFVNFSAQFFNPATIGII